jgi:hypothetical protein
VPAIAAAILRLDIGGSIGIDFPTLAESAIARPWMPPSRRATARRADRLARRTHRNERLASCNLVARLERPLLPALVYSPLGAAARRLLRRAERVRPGRPLLTAHPALAARGRMAGRTDRRTGRVLHWALDESLAPTADGPGDHPR